MHRSPRFSQKVIPLHWIDPCERWVIVPRVVNGKIRKTITPLKKKKGNCYFTAIMPHALIDFIYRSVKKLGLDKQVLIFSRARIKHRNRCLCNGVRIVYLDWDVGISFLIPQRLRYNTMVPVMIDGESFMIHLMEFAILGALLLVAFPSFSKKRCNEWAAQILAKGWKSVGM
ncbi:MAG: hypothetical protein N2316_10810 [Spirochaetes bacterium]|nr:hypothetical protein [Spirochaetota bacterium]